MLYNVILLCLLKSFSQSIFFKLFNDCGAILHCTDILFNPVISQYFLFKLCSFFFFL